MVPLSSQQNHRHQVFADPYVAFSKKQKKKKIQTLQGAAAGQKM